MLTSIFEKHKICLHHTKSLLMSLLNGVPNVPYVPTRSTCPRVQVYFTDRKIKNTGFNEIK